MKEWWRARRAVILPGMIYRVARMIYATLRLKVVGYEAVRDLPCGKIFCGWHGITLIPANFFSHRQVWVIISLSRDGEMQARIFSKFGFNIIRGSTGRGGARALVESIRVLKAKGVMAITPDGPRGPSGVVQGGVLTMAQKSGCALVPVGVYARPAWFAPTWDRYMVPWFFARAVFLMDEPIYVPPDASEDEVEALRLKLQEAIAKTQAEAKRVLTARA